MNNLETKPTPEVAQLAGKALKKMESFEEDHSIQKLAADALDQLNKQDAQAINQQLIERSDEGQDSFTVAEKQMAVEEDAIIKAKVIGKITPLVEMKK